MAVRSTCIQVGGAFRSPRPQVRQFRPFQLSQLRHFDFLRLSPENSTTYARAEVAWILPVFLARHEAILEVSVPNKVKNYARSTRERSNSSGRTGDPDNRPQLKPRKEHEKAGQGHCEIAEELSTENRSRSHDGLRKSRNETISGPDFARSIGMAFSQILEASQVLRHHMRSMSTNSDNANPGWQNRLTCNACG